MPGFLSRIGDINTGKGRLLRGARTVFASGKNVALNSSPLTPHPAGARHKVSKTIPRPSSIIIEGNPIVKVGTTTTCNHRILQGDRTIIVP